MAAMALCAMSLAQDTTGTELQVLKSVNEFRRRNRLAPLRMAGDSLMAAAARHSEEMARRGKLFHAVNLTENCAMVMCRPGEGAGVGERAVLLWIESPRHRANLAGGGNSCAIGVAFAGGCAYLTYRAYYTTAPGELPLDRF